MHAGRERARLLAVMLAQVAHGPGGRGVGCRSPRRAALLAGAGPRGVLAVIGCRGAASVGIGPTIAGARLLVVVTSRAFADLTTAVAALPGLAR